MYIPRYWTGVSIEDIVFHLGRFLSALFSLWQKGLCFVKVAATGYVH